MKIHKPILLAACLAATTSSIADDFGAHSAKETFGFSSKDQFIAKNSQVFGNPFDLPDLKKKADEGDIESNYYMSRLVWYGIHFDKDPEAALAYSNQGAGFSKDAYLWDLALQHAADDISLEEWHEAAYHGVPEALYQVSKHYFRQGPDQDVDLGWFFLSRAKSKGHRGATDLYLAKRSEQKHVLSLEERRTAARVGSVEGLKLLGDSYEGSDQTEINAGKLQRLRRVLEGMGPAND